MVRQPENLSDKLLGAGPSPDGPLEYRLAWDLASPVPGSVRSDLLHIISLFLICIGVIKFHVEEFQAARCCSSGSPGGCCLPAHGSDLLHVISFLLICHVVINFHVGGFQAAQCFSSDSPSGCCLPAHRAYLLHLISLFFNCQSSGWVNPNCLVLEQ